MAFSFPITTPEQARIVVQVYHRMYSTHSAAISASRIGIPLEDFLLIKERIKEELEKARIDEQVEVYLTGIFRGQPANTGGIIAQTVAQVGNASVVSLHNVEPASAVTERSENFETGESTVKGISVSEPRSAEDIIALLKIDTRQFSLKQYWNKEKNGRWEISALVARKSGRQLDAENMESIARRVFADLDIPTLVLPRVIHNERCLIVYPSDKHVAAKVSSIAMYGNDYSAQEYGRRMQVVLDEILLLVRLFGSFDKIIIADMGDKMDGYKKQTTRGGHDLPQNLSDREAYEVCLRTEKHFVDSLFSSGAAARYELIQNANSNHASDFDYWVSRHLEEYVNARYPEVKTRIMQQFIEHIDYGVHTVLLTHGKDDQEMKHGLPRHLSEKAENLINKYILFNQINTREQSVTLAKGDMHLNASETTSSFRYRNVPSLFGSSKWIQTNFGPTIAGCAYDILNKHDPGVLEGCFRFDRGGLVAPHESRALRA